MLTDEFIFFLIQIQICISIELDFVIVIRTFTIGLPLKKIIKKKKNSPERGTQAF